MATQIPPTVKVVDDRLVHSHVVSATPIAGATAYRMMSPAPRRPPSMM